MDLCVFFDVSGVEPTLILLLFHPNVLQRSMTARDADAFHLDRDSEEADGSDVIEKSINLASSILPAVSVVEHEVVPSVRCRQEVTDGSLESVCLNIAIDDLLLDIIEIAVPIVVDDLNLGDTETIKSLGRHDVGPVEA